MWELTKMTISLIKARRNAGKLSFPDSLLGFLSWSSLGLPGTAAIALGTMSLGGMFPGSFPWDHGIQHSVQDTFFFPKYSLFLKSNCIFKNDIAFGDFLLCPQPSAELGGIIEPFTREDKDRRKTVCAWDAQGQTSQRC